VRTYHGCDETQSEDVEMKEAEVDRLTREEDVLLAFLGSLWHEVEFARFLTEKKLSKKVKNHHVTYTVTTTGNKIALWGEDEGCEMDGQNK
jgi:hypothetical protein